MRAAACIVGSAERPLYLQAPIEFPAPVTMLALGGTHACALLDTPRGDVYFWGQRAAGRLGYGDSTEVPCGGESTFGYDTPAIGGGPVPILDD